MHGSMPPQDASPRRIWISTAYGRPTDRWYFESFTYTAAAWIGQPWRDPFVPPNYIGGGTSIEDARGRAERTVCGFGTATVIELPACWARAARFAAKGQPPWPEGRKSRRAAEQEEFRRPSSTHGVGGAPSGRVDVVTTDAFRALGLRVGATEADVRAAFKKLVFKAHPDHGGSDAAFVALKKHYDAALSAVLTQN